MADRVLDLYGRLERLAAGTGLDPGPDTDRAFGELVALCLEEVGPGVLADPRVAAVTPRLRELCAAGEYRLERSWARRVAAAADPEAELRGFPYLENYRALTRLELHTVAGLRATGPGRVCVLGSGPLPLSALLTARALGAAVDAVDVEADATGLAAAVLGRFPDGGLVRTHRADARDFAGLAGADLVVLAALVGLDRPGKQAVLGAVAGRMRPGAVLVVRGAHRLRTLLYPPVDPRDVAAAGRLQVLAEVRPHHDVVNSLLVAAVTG